MPTAGCSTDCNWHVGHIGVSGTSLVSTTSYTEFAVVTQARHEDVGVRALSVFLHRTQTEITYKTTLESFGI